MNTTQTKTGSKMVQIVIAWADTDAVIAKEGRVDLGERHQFRTVIVGKACMWLNDGTDRDVVFATAYAAGQNEEDDYQDGQYVPRATTVRKMRVFTYPTTEKDPLGRAKRDVVKGAK